MAENLSDRENEEPFSFSSFLFTNELLEPISFIIRPSKTRARLKTLIEAGGGKVTSILTGSDAQDFIKILPEGDECTSDNWISPSYVDDCVAANSLLDKSNYRVEPTKKKKKNGSSVVFVEKAVKGRIPYTAEEDEKILRHIARRAHQYGGNEVWKRMEKMKITNHSWQSMKDHFKHKLEHRLTKYIKERKKDIQFVRLKGKDRGTDEGGDKIDEVADEHADDNDDDDEFDIDDESMYVRREATDEELDQDRRDEEEVRRLENGAMDVEEEKEGGGIDGVEDTMETASNASSFDVFLLSAAGARSGKAKRKRKVPLIVDNSSDSSEHENDDDDVVVSFPQIGITGSTRKNISTNNNKNLAEDIPSTSNEFNLRNRTIRKNINNSATKKGAKKEDNSVVDYSDFITDSDNDRNDPKPATSAQASSFQDAFLKQISSDAANPDDDSEIPTEIHENGEEEADKRGNEQEEAGDVDEVQMEEDLDATQIDENEPASDEVVGSPASKRPKRTGSSTTEEPSIIRLTPRRKKKKTPKKPTPLQKTPKSSKSKSETSDKTSPKSPSGVVTRVTRAARKLQLHEATPRKIRQATKKTDNATDLPSCSTGGEEADTEASPAKTTRKQKKKKSLTVPESETESTLSDVIPMSRTRQTRAQEIPMDFTIPETQEFDVVMNGHSENADDDHEEEEEDIEKQLEECDHVLEDLMERYKIPMYLVCAALYINDGSVSKTESFLSSKAFQLRQKYLKKNTGSVAHTNT